MTAKNFDELPVIWRDAANILMYTASDTRDHVRLVEGAQTLERCANDLIASGAHHLVDALKRIADWTDCGCEDHTAPECCAQHPSHEFHCPGCIAALALTKAGF